MERNYVNLISGPPHAEIGNKGVKWDTSAKWSNGLVERGTGVVGGNDTNGLIPQNTIIIGFTNTF